MSRPSRRAAAALTFVMSTYGTSALAFRPFDGTDAAVTDPGTIEIELGALGYLREGADRSLIAPSVRLNYGFAEGWEAVIEGQAAHGLSSGARGSRIMANAASLKRVLREGGLQDKPGPSIATELSLLLPGINDEPGTGGSVAGIVSQQWPWLTVHFNLLAAVTRQQHGDVFVGVIVEGPREWPVRPVAEVFREREFGGLTVTSGLIGAIWQVRDSLAFDAGLRRAGLNDRTLDEVRLGLTFSFPVR
jgi:hypothetical protein